MGYVTASSHGSRIGPRFSRVFSEEVQRSGVKGFTAGAVPFNIYAPLTAA